MLKKLKELYDWVTETIFNIALIIGYLAFWWEFTDYIFNYNRDYKYIMVFIAILLFGKHINKKDNEEHKKSKETIQELSDAIDLTKLIYTIDYNKLSTIGNISVGSFFNNSVFIHTKNGKNISGDLKYLYWIKTFDDILELDNRLSKIDSDLDRLQILSTIYFEKEYK